MFHFPESVFHFPESMFHFRRNRCSTSAGIDVPLPPDSVFQFRRNTQPGRSELPEFAEHTRDGLLYLAVGNLLNQVLLGPHEAYRELPQRMTALDLLLEGFARPLSEEAELELCH